MNKLQTLLQYDRLINAAKSDDWVAIRDLRDEGFDLSVNYNMALRVCIKYNSILAFDELLKANYYPGDGSTVAIGIEPNIGCKGLTGNALAMSIRMGRIHMTRALLQYGALADSVTTIHLRWYNRDKEEKVEQCMQLLGKYRISQNN